MVLSVGALHSFVCVNGYFCDKLLVLIGNFLTYADGWLLKCVKAYPRQVPLIWAPFFFYLVQYFLL